MNAREQNGILMMGTDGKYGFSGFSETWNGKRPEFIGRGVTNAREQIDTCDGHRRR